MKQINNCEGKKWGKACEGENNIQIKKNKKIKKVRIKE